MSSKPHLFNFFYRGFVCCGIIGALKTWCGYVGVGEGHPLYEIYYNDIDEIIVHGGLTFSGFFEADNSINQYLNVWWLGFDCAHVGDLIPGVTYTRTGDVYRNIDFVKDECKSLARQLSDWSIGGV